MKLNNYHKQQGFSIALLIGLIALLGIIGFLGSTIYTSIIGGNQRSNLSIQSSQSLTQASYILSTEITRNASGIPIAKAILANGFAPSGGGIIPSTSAAPKLDSFGSYIGYCVNAAVNQTDPVFAIISAGPDKNFNTTCTQALAGTTVGDDKVITKNVASINSGVGGTVFFGDPVPTVADLANLTAASIKPGQLRTVLADGTIWVNATGVVGASNWVKAGAAGGSGSGSGGGGPSIMYLDTNLGYSTAAAACPTGWTEVDYKITGYSNGYIYRRTCINSAPFSIMYLDTNLGYSTAAAACPTGWTEADYKITGYSGGYIYRRTCYIAQTSGGSGGGSTGCSAPVNNPQGVYGVYNSDGTSSYNVVYSIGTVLYQLAGSSATGTKIHSYNSNTYKSAYYAPGENYYCPNNYCTQKTVLTCDAKLGWVSGASGVWTINIGSGTMTLTNLVIQVN